MQIKTPLSGERITIRDYVRTDLPFVAGMWFDGENGKYLSDPTAGFVDENYQKALDGMEDNPAGYYLVIETKDFPVGSCCMFPDKAGQVYDIGYCIHKKYWRRGYGTEAILLLKEWIQARGGREITAEVAAENAASNLLLRKMGFEMHRKSEFRKYKMDVHYESYIYRLVLR